MATAAKNTFPVSRSPLPAKKAKRKRELPLREVMAERDKAARRGEYEILGRLLVMRTDAGMIDFGNKGPWLGRLQTAEAPLVLLDEWNGLPDQVSVLPELCDACRTECTDCGGHGERVCMFPGCGGYGKVIVSWEACGAEGCLRLTGKVNPACKVCGGGGNVVGQTQECPTCHGSKKQECPRCQGSGRMCTGHEHGSTEQTSPTCPECHGNGRKLKTEPCDWKPYSLGKLEDFVALGTISTMAWFAHVERDPNQSLEICRVRPDRTGNMMVLLVDKPEEKNRPMYLYGGEPVITAKH